MVSQHFVRNLVSRVPATCLSHSIPTIVIIYDSRDRRRDTLLSTREFFQVLLSAAYRYRMLSVASNKRVQSL